MRRRITEILLYCLLLSLVFGGISVQAEENRKESAEGRILLSVLIIMGGIRYSPR